ncbi:MAG: hypothetical protein GYA50_00660 [Eubacteriaceae bacterium]|nr:hypothetical protein [Eubacteriaceae bacterium]
MIKKILLITGAVIAVFFLEDILYAVTKIGVVAHWGNIIIPSYLIGIIAKRVLKNSDLKKFAQIAAVFVVATKLVMMYIQIDNMTILTIILCAVIYYLTSYFCILLGEKI